MTYTIRTMQDGIVIDSDTATEADVSTYYPTVTEVAFGIFESWQIVQANENTPIENMGKTIEIIEDASGSMIASYTFD